MKTTPRTIGRRFCPNGHDVLQWGWYIKSNGARGLARTCRRCLLDTRAQHARRYRAKYPEKMREQGKRRRQRIMERVNNDPVFRAEYYRRANERAKRYNKSPGWRAKHAERQRRRRRMLGEVWREHIRQYYADNRERIGVLAIMRRVFGVGAFSAEGAKEWQEAATATARASRVVWHLQRGRTFDAGQTRG